MWRNLEEEAIYIGLNLDYFWNLTPNAYQKYRKVFEKKRKEDLQNQDYLNNILGQYINYAFNNPKKYPKPFLSEKIKMRHSMTSAEMEEQVRRNTLMMGGVINDNR